MPTVSKNRIEKSYLTDQERWEAVIHRDKNADDAFVYSVKTTGVYCRPSCPARLARRENVAFHLTPKDAERAGFRACKRCKPNDPSAHGEQAAIVAKACKLIVDAEEPLSLDALAEAIGMSPWHFHRVFKSMTGLTPKAYAAAHRAKRMHQELSRRGTVTSAIYNSGFNSNGRFYAESNKRLGMKPTEFKAGGDGATIRFAVGECSLGSILVAASDLGICSIAIGNDPNTLVKELQDRFPNAELIGGDKQFERMVAGSWPSWRTRRPGWNCRCMSKAPHFSSGFGKLCAKSPAVRPAPTRNSRKARPAERHACRRGSLRR